MKVHSSDWQGCFHPAFLKLFKFFCLNCLQINVRIFFSFFEFNWNHYKLHNTLAQNNKKRFIERHRLQSISCHFTDKFLMTIYRKSTRRKIPPKAVQGAVTSSPKFHFPPHKNHFTISTFFLSLHPTELRVVCENKTPARLNPEANRIDHKDSAFRAMATSLSSLITSLKRENQ